MPPFLSEDCAKPAPHCVKQAGAKEAVICLTVPKRPVPHCAKEVGASLIAGTLGSTRYNQSLYKNAGIYQDRIYIYIYIYIHIYKYTILAQVSPIVPAT